MSNKETIALRCPCEKEHVFEETFFTIGEGSTTVQVRCPHAQCPTKHLLLSYAIPFELRRDEAPIKTYSTHLKP